MAFSPKNLASLVAVAIQHNASDIHIRYNEVPCLRIRGELIPVQTKTFAESDVMDIVKILLDKELTNQDIMTISELDGAYTIPELCRIRFNIFKYFNHQIYHHYT